MKTISASISVQLFFILNFAKNLVSLFDEEFFCSSVLEDTLVSTSSTSGTISYSISSSSSRFSGMNPMVSER